MAVPDRSSDGVHWSVERLADYVGLTALASGGLLLAGLGFTTAYLSAWGIPLSAVELDPIGTALRSDAAIYDALVIAAVAAACTVVLRPLRRAAGDRAAVAGVVVAGLIAAVLAGTLLYAGLALAVAVGLVIAVGRERAWLRGWHIAAAFAVGALLSGYLTGYSVGLRIRQDDSRQTPVKLTTAVPVAGLTGGVENGGAWHYDGLYFVYRDAAVLYVSRGGSGATAWGIAEFNLRSFSMATAR